MALLGSNFNDPQTQGILSLALGLLSAGGPQVRPTSVGQAIGNAGMGAMQAYQGAIDSQMKRDIGNANLQNLLAQAELRKAQAKRYSELASQGIDPTTPSNVREWMYYNALPPENQKKYLEMKRQIYGVTNIGGVPNLVAKSPGISPQPLSSLSNEVGGKAAIARGEQAAKEQEKARYDLTDVFNPNTNKIEQRPRLSLIPGQSPAQFPSGYAPADQVRQAQQDFLRGTSDPLLRKDIQSGFNPGTETASSTPDTNAPLSPKQSQVTQAKGKASQALATTEDAMDRLAAEATAIRDNPALGRITGPLSMFPNFPGSKASDVAARFETLKSQTAFAVLQAMRDAAKTGGALGQVSNFEEQMLQNALAGISQAQSPKAMQDAMNRIIDYTKGAKRRMREGFIQTFGEESNQAAPASDPLGIRQ